MACSAAICFAVKGSRLNGRAPSDTPFACANPCPGPTTAGDAFPTFCCLSAGQWGLLDAVAAGDAHLLIRSDGAAPSASVRNRVLQSVATPPWLSELDSPCHASHHSLGARSLSSYFFSSMPVSEIDAIFASKGKAAVAPPKPSSSSSAQPEQKKKKKKDKEKAAKRKRDDADADDAAPSKPPKRQVPETVFDPSAGLPSAKATKPAKVDKSASSVVKQKKPKKDREEEQRFKDSRGTGPRTLYIPRLRELLLTFVYRSNNRRRVLDLQRRRAGYCRQRRRYPIVSIRLPVL